LKIFEILDTEPTKNVWDLPSSEAGKVMKNSKFSLTPGEWKKNGTDWENNDGQRLVFYSTTMYSKSGNLRVPEKTKYQVYVTLFNGRNSVTADFGSARGESTASRDKIDAVKTKVIAWAKKSFDIELTEYGFKY
jgi:hypothetical protein